MREPSRVASDTWATAGFPVKMMRREYERILTSYAGFFGFAFGVLARIYRATARQLAERGFGLEWRLFLRGNILHDRCGDS